MKIFLLLISLFIFSCDGDPISPEDGDSSSTGTNDNVCDGEYLQIWGAYYDVGTTTEIGMGDISSTGNVFPLDRLQCFENLTSLEIQGPINWINEINSLTNLTHLEFEIIYTDEYINANYPVIDITNLESLSLEYRATGGNILISEYPIILGDLINLKTLWLYVWSNDNELGETIYINIPSEVYNLISLNELWVGGDIGGEIHSDIKNLVNLTSLELNYSTSFTGSIPSEIGDLVNLTNLDLYSSGLTGSIPIEIGNLINLTNLELHYNQLTGAIPAEIGNLINLTNLELDDNQLTGTIPTEIGNLINLTNLALDDNQLSGLIPPEICNQGDSTPDIDDNNLCPDNFNEYPACDGIPITSTSEQNISECGK